MLNQPYLGPEHERQAGDQFNHAAGQFGREYARGQGFWNLAASSMRTSRNRLADRMLTLAEVRARIAGQGQTLQAVYRQTVADAVAREWLAVSNESHDVTFHTTHTSDPVGAVYRGFWLRTDGLRLLAAVGTGLAIQQGWADGSNRLLIDGAIVAGVTGAIDVGRRFWTIITTRHLANLPVSHTAEVIRRRASFAEGVITGDLTDHHDAPAPYNVQGEQNTISAELQSRMATELARQLEADGITPPPPAGSANTDWATRFRQSLRETLSEFNDLNELVRARDAAKRSRLARTLLATLLTAGLIAGNHLRPESSPDCGIQPMSGPDRDMPAKIGTPKPHSLEGLGKAIWFKEVYGHTFVDSDPKDQDRLHKFLSQVDPEFARQLSMKLGNEFLEKNRGDDKVVLVSDDLILSSGDLKALCRSEVERVLQEVGTQFRTSK